MAEKKKSGKIAKVAPATKNVKPGAPAKKTKKKK
jgi:hypothetical protein